MKKRFSSLIIGILVGFSAFQFGPSLFVRFFGEENVRRISERFTETLMETNELVVSELEITGSETVTQQAWLIGNVQSVEMPYTFSMCFTVDLSKASVSAEGQTIIVKIPLPQASRPKLVVDEENVKKTDWLYRLTPERYATIQKETEEGLFAEYRKNDAYCSQAWDSAVHDLKGLFEPILSDSLFGNQYEIVIVPLDDSSGQ